jgi:hypothetical protein
MAAILINIEISLLNELMMEEGNTLSYTLLPYLNECTDYSFLPEHSHFIINRFLQSLVRHIKDTKSEVEMGFMIFGLTFNPSILQDIVEYRDNAKALKGACKH